MAPFYSGGRSSTPWFRISCRAPRPGVVIINSSFLLLHEASHVAIASFIARRADRVESRDAPLPRRRPVAAGRLPPTGEARPCGHPPCGPAHRPAARSRRRPRKRAGPGARRVSAADAVSRERRRTERHVAGGVYRPGKILLAAAAIAPRLLVGGGVAVDSVLPGGLRPRWFDLHPWLLAQ